MEESVYKISSQISTISRNQKYFRTRENRNFDTVRNTEGRIVNFSLIQSGLIICMGALQVFVVRFFFQVRTSAIVCILVRRDSPDTNEFPGGAQGIRINGNDWAFCGEWAGYSGVCCLSSRAVFMEGSHSWSWGE